MTSPDCPSELAGVKPFGYLQKRNEFGIGIVEDSSTLSSEYEIWTLVIRIQIQESDNCAKLPPL